MESNFLNEFKRGFEKVKARGWINTQRYKLRKNDDGAIGRFFEDAMLVEENNLDTPDFGDIEIKTQRRLTGSMLTLFSKAPDYPKGVNSIIREKYGYLDPKHGKNRLNATASATQFINSENNPFSFKLKIDTTNEKIKLIVRDTEGNVSDPDIYYNFSTIQSVMQSKLSKIAYLEVDIKDENGVKYIKFDSLKLLYEPKLSNLIQLIEDGHIKIDIRLGIYDTPGKKSYGKYHDHGTAFRIPKNRIPDLYAVLKV